MSDLIPRVQPLMFEGQAGSQLDCDIPVSGPTLTNEAINCYY